jgi:hypothetical protein
VVRYVKAEEVNLSDGAAAELWHAIQQRLDRSLPSWREMIENLGQVAAVERRETGTRWSDDEVFEALLRAVLSNNTDWAKVEGVLPELRDAFSGFSLAIYAETTEEEVKQRLVPWFKSRKAGSMTLRRSLLGLTKTARLLLDWSASHGFAEHYFLDVIASCGGDPNLAALAIGRSGSSKKLPALGVPIAAESLRNMGFDLSKPDRHVCRAVGSFELVQFQIWPDRTGTKAPAAGAGEMLDTMKVVEALACRVGTRPTFLDNAIWLTCSRMGFHLGNAELAAMASDTRGSR